MPVTTLSCLSVLSPVHRNDLLEHDNRQQAIIIAELQAALTSTSVRLEVTQQHNAALHRYAVAHGAAYGRIVSHAAGLHQQFARQLAGLRQLCRHLGLQLAAALAAADPLPALGEAAASASSSEVVAAGTSAAGAAAAPSDLPGSAAAVAAAVLAIDSLRTELTVALQLLDMQESSSEAQQLAAVPAGIAEALEADLAGLPAELLCSPRLEPAGSPATSGATSASASPSTKLAGYPVVSAVAAQQPGTKAPQALAQAALAAGAGPGSKSGPSPRPPPSVLSAQMAQMEAHLQRLVGSSAEQAARTAAAAQLHGEELGARRRAQEVASELATQLAAVQVGGDLGKWRRRARLRACRSVHQLHVFKGQSAVFAAAGFIAAAGYAMVQSCRGHQGHNTSSHLKMAMSCGLSQSFESFMTTLPYSGCPFPSAG